MERKRVIIVGRNKDGNLSDSGELVTHTEVVIRNLSRWRRVYEATVYNSNGITTVEAGRVDLLGKEIRRVTSDMRGVTICVTPEARLSKTQKTKLFEATSRKELPKPRAISPNTPFRKESPHANVLVELPRIVI